MGRRMWAAVAAAVLFAGAYLGSPFWAARQFREAALSADADRLAAAVDFPAVRESLKSQLTTMLTTRMHDDPALRANPFAGLGTVLMPALVGHVVNGFVTPDGIAALVKRGRPGNRGVEAGHAPDVSVRYDYRSLDRFAVSAVPPDGKAGAPTFVFERRGLFRWMVIRLELPDGVLAGAS